MFKDVDFRAVYTGYVGTSLGRIFSKGRQKATKEEQSTSANNSGNRSGFNKLREAGSSVAKEGSHDDKRRQNMERASGIEVGYELM